MKPTKKDRGWSCWDYKLPEPVRFAMRLKWALGGTLRGIARQYRVSPATVHRVIHEVAP
jgi:hypothetical protein